MYFLVRFVSKKIKKRTDSKILVFNHFLQKMNFSASLCHATDLKIQNFVENGSFPRGMDTKHFGPAFLLLYTRQVYLCKILQIIFDHLYYLATETLHICVTSLWNLCFKIAKNKKERNKERRK